MNTTNIANPPRIIRNLLLGFGGGGIDGGGETISKDGAGEIFIL